MLRGEAFDDPGARRRRGGSAGDRGGDSGDPARTPTRSARAATRPRTRGARHRDRRTPSRRPPPGVRVRPDPRSPRSAATPTHRAGSPAVGRRSSRRTPRPRAARPHRGRGPDGADRATRRAPTRGDGHRVVGSSCRCSWCRRRIRARRPHARAGSGHRARRRGRPCPSVIAFGSATPASSASSCHRCHCTIGSAYTSSISSAVRLVLHPPLTDPVSHGMRRSP